MNRNQISLAEAEGKTFGKFIQSHFCEELLIAIGSDEFVVVESQARYDSVSVIEVDDVEFYRTNYSEVALATIFDANTLAEWKAIDDKCVREQRERQELAERRQFEELKAKFEGKPS